MDFIVIILSIELLILIGMIWMVWKKLCSVTDIDIPDMVDDHIDTTDRLHDISHDLQQIKVRLTYSKRREKKDLMFETGGVTISKVKPTKSHVVRFRK